ncbi:MAG: MBL fold metallo-hydrolase [Bacteroidia bacterium]|jgi:L-ascorbate metabolism protein UlaG (beta-lactamase superfamily)|nr:MBL fold metallo-hydrolase [Bacteroidia bacterium]
MLIAFSLLALPAGIYLFMKTSRFGKPASGTRLERIKKSPNYTGNQFVNQSQTPNFAEGVTMPMVLKSFFFENSPNGKPKQPLPSHKTDLTKISDDSFVWFGHSSYLLRTSSKNILVDPVFSGNASPLSFTTKAFPGSNVYGVADMPEIDYLIITHDHWDHLDYRTVIALDKKVKHIITGLGTGSHLEHWGISPAKITELDWWESFTGEDGFRFTATPARHFSGRGFKRNQHLWISLVLETGAKKIYLGGDSGYDAHFKVIGNKFGSFDLAILECGQYHPYWKYIHMLPEETALAADDLNAKKFIPVHWGKFRLSLHDWDEPMKTVSQQKSASVLITPEIGKAINTEIPNESIQWWTKFQ